EGEQRVGRDRFRPACSADAVAFEVDDCVVADDHDGDTGDGPGLHGLAHGGVGAVLACRPESGSGDEEAPPGDHASWTSQPPWPSMPTWYSRANPSLRLGRSRRLLVAYRATSGTRALPRRAWFRSRHGARLDSK